MLDEAVRRNVNVFYEKIFGNTPDSEAPAAAGPLGGVQICDLLERFAWSFETRKAVLRSNDTPAFEFDNDQYIASSLNSFEKRTCFYYHYSFLCSILREEALEKIFDANSSQVEIPLFTYKPAETVHTIALSYAHRGRNEGELSLFFKYDGAPLFVVGFTIVPGYVVGLPDQRTLILSQMKGCKGEFDDIRRATKELNEVSPRTALVAAINGVAQALGLEHIVGVAAMNHVSRDWEGREALAQAYDQFFVSLGADKSANGFFYFVAPLPERPLSEIKQTRRRRARVKRGVKAEIANQARAALENLMRLTGDLSSDSIAARHLFDRLSASNRELAEELKMELAQVEEKLEEQGRELADANRSLLAECSQAREELARVVSANAKLRAEAERNRLERDRLIAAPPFLARMLIARGVPFLSRAAERREVDRLVGALFDTEYYLDQHPDVRARGVCPVLHYVRHGWREGRAMRLAEGLPSEVSPASG